MGRKGGGKKAFLKGVVAKPDVDDAGADQGSTEAGAALPQPATSHTASEHTETPSAGPQLPDVRSTAENLSSESRGQLTQRHKKVRCRCRANCPFSNLIASAPMFRFAGGKGAERGCQEIRKEEEGMAAIQQYYVDCSFPSKHDWCAW